MLSLVLPPLMGGVIGYITNDIAIRMLFRPHKAKYIFGVHVPFTPGIIPKEKGRIAKAMGDAISQNLMNKDVLERTLLSDELIQKMKSSIDQFCQKQCLNKESLRAFVSRYLSEEDVNQLVGSTKTEFERLLSDSLASSNFGDDIAHIAVKHALEKVAGSFWGTFGADKLLGPIAAVAEPRLAKEINSMIKDNSSTIMHNIVDEQGEKFINTPMCKFFLGHEEQIENAKTAILSVYRTIILEHLPRILATLNISQIVEQRINEMDMNEIEPIILEVMNKELKAIVWFGAGLGTIIGCANLIF